MDLLRWSRFFAVLGLLFLKRFRRESILRELLNVQLNDLRIFDACDVDDIEGVFRFAWLEIPSVPVHRTCAHSFAGCHRGSMSAKRSQGVVRRLPKQDSATYLRKISSLPAIYSTRWLREMSVGGPRRDQVAVQPALEQRMVWWTAQNRVRLWITGSFGGANIFHSNSVHLNYHKCERLSIDLI